MKDMMELRDAIHKVYETPGEKEGATQLFFAHSGSYASGIQHATYQGQAFDCEHDLVPFVVQWVKTEHYETCILYQGAGIIMLEAEGSAVYTPDEFPFDDPR